MAMASVKYTYTYTHIHTHIHIHIHCIACSLLACLSSDIEHGNGFGHISGLLEWTILMGEEGEGDNGVMAAREVAGVLQWVAMCCGVL